jgi:hypothetical protein
MTAVIFYLKTRGRNRGYVERYGYLNQNDQPSDAPQYVVILPDNGRGPPPDPNEPDATEPRTWPSDPVREDAVLI